MDKTQGWGAVEDNKNMPVIMNFVKYLKSNLKRRILNLFPKLQNIFNCRYSGGLFIIFFENQSQQRYIDIFDQND